MPGDRVGAMRELLTIQSSTPPILEVTLTRVGTLATGTTEVPHDYRSSDWVLITAEGSPLVEDYNGRHPVTVTGPTTFTFPVASGLTTPVTATVTFTGDAEGAQREFWSTVITVPAARDAIGSSERLQREAVQSAVDHRFRVRTRADVTAKMRVLWTPSWPTGTAKVLKLSGDPVVEEAGVYMTLNCVEPGV